MCLLLRSVVWPLYHNGLIDGVLKRSLAFWYVLPSPEEFLSVTIGFWVTSLTKVLLHRLLILAGWPALLRVLVVPNFFHLIMMEATLFLSTFKDVQD